MCLAVVQVVRTSLTPVSLPVLIIMKKSPFSPSVSHPHEFPFFVSLPRLEQKGKYEMRQNRKKKKNTCRRVETFAIFIFLVTSAFYSYFPHFLTRPQIFEKNKNANSKISIEWRWESVVCAVQFKSVFERSSSVCWGGNLAGGIVVALFLFFCLPFEGQRVKVSEKSPWGKKRHKTMQFSLKI